LEKARVEIKGRLAFIETESGAKAVVPASSLCSLIKRFNLVVDNKDVRC
jgi:hypothetical protein